MPVFEEMRARLAVAREGMLEQVLDVALWLVRGSPGPFFKPKKGKIVRRSPTNNSPASSSAVVAEETPHENGVDRRGLGHTCPLITERVVCPSSQGHVPPVIPLLPICFNMISSSVVDISEGYSPPPHMDLISEYLGDTQDAEGMKKVDEDKAEAEEQFAVLEGMRRPVGGDGTTSLGVHITRVEERLRHATEQVNLAQRELSTVCEYYYPRVPPRPGMRGRGRRDALAHLPLPQAGMRWLNILASSPALSWRERAGHSPNASRSDSLTSFGRRESRLALLLCGRKPYNPFLPTAFKTFIPSPLSATFGSPAPYKNYCVLLGDLTARWVVAAVTLTGEANALGPSPNTHSPMPPLSNTSFLTRSATSFCRALWRGDPFTCFLREERIEFSLAVFRKLFSFQANKDGIAYFSSNHVKAKLPMAEIATTINEFRTRHLSELAEVILPLDPIGRVSSTRGKLANLLGRRALATAVHLLYLGECELGRNGSLTFYGGRPTTRSPRQAQAGWVGSRSSLARPWRE
ncbi:hypothetical protein KSP39_PZI004289 [Platanthera zijinensis]|uniref:Uncharacterized protein n=1 Tax=Platanthera zijinensis TaxID=2320716 RepID=A0AAP0BUF5_9ASPA